MSGGTGRIPRLVVGIDRSRASRWALAWAVGEARRRGACVLVVHVFRPPVTSSPAITDLGASGLLWDPYTERAANGSALILEATREAVGLQPGDVAMEERVISGRPATELTSLACGGDLLVLGSRGCHDRFVPPRPAVLIPAPAGPWGDRATDAHGGARAGRAGPVW